MPLTGVALRNQVVRHDERLPKLCVGSRKLWTFRTPKLPSDRPGHKQDQPTSTQEEKFRKRR